MAEIKIEKKKPIWPWIILALIILALLYFFVFANDDDVTDDVDDNTEQVVWDEDSTTTDWDDDTTTNWDNDSLSMTGVAGYMAYIDNDAKMGVDHEYTNNALMKLIEAVEAKASEVNYDVTADMQAARKDAEKITNDPTAVNHAGTIKDAGNKIATALSKMQKDKFPNLTSDVEEVKKAVENINPDTQTLNQKDQINEFFEEAGEVLEKMS